MIDILLVATVCYGCNTFRSEPVLTVQILLDFLFIKHSFPENIHFELRAEVLETVCLKKTDELPTCKI